MDTQTTHNSTESAVAAQTQSFSLAEVVEQINGFVRRQYPIFVLVMACAFALGISYLLTTPPRYTAHAMMVIDNSKLRVLQEQQAPQFGVPLDTAQVETQVEVLRSDNIGLAVIKDLGLTKDPEFTGGGKGFLGAVVAFASNLLGQAQRSSEDAIARRALEVFQKYEQITRVGRTYVLDIAYSSLSPEQSAKIANAIADSYITDQLDAKYQATRRAGGWLQDRIKELRLQAAQADKAVLDYKEKNKIIDIGVDNSINKTGSRLLGEQALAESNTQLVTARNATAEAKAKLDRIQELMKQDLPDSAVTDSLHSEVITRLRNQYLELSGKEAIWASRYGADHLAAVNLRIQMTELRHSIANELNRIAGSYKSDYEIAKERQISLEQSFAKQIVEAQSINRDRLGLNDLEATAHVYHTIYDNFLQHYMEAIQQESFPITETRVISSAKPPLVKSSPRATIVLAMAAALGLVVSFAAASLREAMDRVFRTTKDVEGKLGLSCLAVLPALGRRALTNVTRVLPNKQFERPERVLRFEGAGRLRHVIEEPLSAFAEALRSLKVAVDINSVLKNIKVIGIASTIPREGKSTVACNFAELVAHTGKRAILVDGDLRNPSLTKLLARDAKSGLLEVLRRKSDLREVTYLDVSTGLAFLPAVIKSRLVYSNEVLASSAFKELIESLAQSYDYVIVDLPPLAPVVDVRAAANVMDCFIFVVEWGKTGTHLVQHQLASAPEVSDRIIGAVLNKADMNVLNRHQYYYGADYNKYHYQPDVTT
jgi:polysaccharide biosynthesis transport protein